MTCNVFSGTLNPSQSINHRVKHWLLLYISSAVQWHTIYFFERWVLYTAYR